MFHLNFLLLRVMKCVSFISCVELLNGKEKLMSIHQELVNLDKVYRELKGNPIIINDLANITDRERQRINDLIRVTYNSDLLKSVASCPCDHTIGEHRIGEICTECGNPCAPPIEQELDPIVWMRAPKGVRSLLNPTIYTMLSERFTKGGHDIIRWICDSEYQSKRKPIKEIELLESMGFKRSYNWFVDNFDKIMETLFTMPKLARKPSDTGSGYQQSKDLQEILRVYRDRIFSKYLPLPNRSLLIIEKTESTSMVDNSVVGVLDAINTIASIDHPLTVMKQSTRENRTFRSIAGIAAFGDSWIADSLGEKPGLSRRHMFGTRSNFSIRTVVTSITDVHEDDELHIPWGAAIGAFRYHLINKLRKLDYTPNEATALLNKYANMYSPLLDRLFQELIAESPYGGIPATLGRNPSLARGSMYLVRITKVKTDVADPTSSFSILVITAPNADFDGDAMSIVICGDNYTAHALRDLAPYKSALNLEEVRKLSSDLFQPKPGVANLSNYMRSPVELITSPDEELFMNQMAI